MYLAMDHAQLARTPTLDVMAGFIIMPLEVLVIVVLFKKESQAFFVKQKT